MIVNLFFALNALTGILQVAWIFILIIVCGLFWNFVTVLIHEMGHAIPSLLFTDKPVRVFVGTHQPDEVTFGYDFGRLSLGFVPLFVPYDSGVCYHFPAKKWEHEVMITAGGVVFTFVSALLFMTLVYQANGSDFIKFNAIFFLGLSTWQFITNLWPRATTMNSISGEVIYTDGYSLQMLLREKFGSEEYRNISELYERRNFSAAAQELNSFRKGNKITRKIYDLGKKVYAGNKDWRAILTLTDEFSDGSTKSLKSTDYYDIGVAYFQVKDNQNALRCFEKVLFFEPFNAAAFKKSGEANHALQNWKDAEHDYERAAQLSPDDADVHFKMSFIKFYFKKQNEGWAHLKRATELSPSDPKTHFFAAKYLYKIGNLTEARKSIAISKKNGGERVFNDFKVIENEILR